MRLEGVLHFLYSSARCKGEKNITKLELKVGEKVIK